MVAPMPEPVTLHFAESALLDLRARLAATRWPDQPDAANDWRQGTDLAYLKTLVEHWRDRYAWRDRERALNRLPNYSEPIDGIDLHFVHERGIGPAPMPLLLLHGWPSSFMEFNRVLPMLTDPARFGGDARDAFSVVVPSLPGYGLSFRPGQPRADLAQIAEILATLMQQRLGYDRFGVHGGDWGAHVATRLAHARAELLAGIHLTMLILPRPSQPATEQEREYAEAVARWNRDHAGYAIIQGTRPQTLAYGLNDSPAGLAAWLVEKYREWSDCGGDIERRFDKDTLLDIVTWYWLTGSINSSFGLYHSLRQGSSALPKGARVDIPTGHARFPAGSLHAPRSLAERTYDIRHWTVMNAGGHFPALEEPEALVKDIRDFFRPLRTPS
jgi:pimeloyl-ACP methyl ester carboxylesterase